MQNYIQMKLAGLVTVVMANGSPALAVSKYDAFGKIVPSDEQGVDAESIQSQIDAFAAQQLDLAALLSDINAAMANASADPAATELLIARAKKRAEVNNERDRRGTQGVSYVFPDGLTGIIQTRGDRDIININGQATAALALMAISQSSKLMFFVDEENVSHDLTPPQVIQMGFAVQGMLSKVCATATDAKQRLDKMDLEEVSAFDPVNGW